MTFGASATPADAPIGPRGPVPPASYPVLQLTYSYGSPNRQVGSSASLVFVADGASAELADPTRHQVLLRAASE